MAGSKSLATAGSATNPRPTEHIVIPSCAPASMKDSSCIDLSAMAARSLSRAICSIFVLRAATSANSTPTKKPLARSSATAATRYHVVVVTRAVSSSGRRLGPDHQHLRDPAPLHVRHLQL